MIEKLPEFAGNHPLLLAALIGIIALLIFVELARKSRGYSEIGPAALTDLINREDARVIDIRAVGEFSAGHIVNARHLDAAKLAAQAETLAADDKTPLVVVCANGQQSAKACQQLKTAGASGVYLLAGGIAAWRSDNLPLSHGK